MFSYSKSSHGIQTCKGLDVSTDLDLSQLPRALHPTRHVHRVAPDVVLRFPRPNHSSDDWAVVNACG